MHHVHSFFIIPKVLFNLAYGSVELQVLYKERIVRQPYYSPQFMHTINIYPFI